MKPMYRVCLVMAVFCCCGVIAFAAGVPTTLNYQGTLTDGTGNPVTATKKMTFKMYTTAIGGSAFWAEPPQSVNVNKGQFSVVLGNTTAVPSDKLTGTTYIGVSVDPASEMLPRQKLTSVAYALNAANAVNATNAVYAQTALNVASAVPKGIVVMWSGAVAQIPSGWALCDGANGTPDLRDRFVIGAGGGYAKGQAGGEAEHLLKVSEMPSHTHPQNPHSHGLNGWCIDQGAKSCNNGNVTQDNSPWTNYGSITNTAATNLNTGGDQPHNNLPPYYALAFIMKL